MSVVNSSPSDLWDQSEYSVREYGDAPLTDALVAEVEARLGYRLPKAYVDLCKRQNGGLVTRDCHRTNKPTSWADDHICITNIKGIGFRNTWSLSGDLGQGNAIENWGYPPVGVYFADCPSAGHDRLCLDYTLLNADGEPAVVHVDQERDYSRTLVASSFENFLAGLESDDAFDLPDDEGDLAEVGNAQTAQPPADPGRGWLPMRLVLAIIVLAGLVAAGRYFLSAG